MTDKPKKGRWEYYSKSDNKLERLKKSCPRCGSGTYLAQHKDRLSCGKCGYTEFGNKSAEGQPRADQPRQDQPKGDQSQQEKSQ